MATDEDEGTPWPPPSMEESVVEAGLEVVAVALDDDPPDELPPPPRVPPPPAAALSLTYSECCNWLALCWGGSLFGTGIDVCNLNQYHH